jgi:hypothetical protein
VAVVCSLTACGGSSRSSQATAQLIVAATSGADTARFHTVVSVEESAPGGFHYDTSGAVDFANPRGFITNTVFPDKASTSTDAVPVTTEARWIGDDIYFEGAGGLVGNAPGEWTLVNAAKFHAGASCLSKHDVLALLTGSGVESPTGILDSLKEHGHDLERVGPEAIHGIATTHWRVAPTVWPAGPSCNPRESVQHVSDRVGLDIWTDTRDRALRFRLSQVQTNTADGHTDTQKSATTTDFSDFGDSVNVDRPPAAQVVDETDALIAVTLGPGTAKESDWQDVAHGVIGSRPWKIYAARTTTGWRCFDTADTPQDSLGEISDSGVPTHNGHSTSCLVATGLDSFLGPVNIFVNRADGSQRTLVGASPNSGAVRIEFKDGSSEPIAVDARTWVFVWSGTKAQVPIRLKIGAVSCRLDGRGAAGLAAAGQQEIACDGIPTYG